MKKKILIVLLAAITALTMSLCLAACGGNSGSGGGEHVHSLTEMPEVPAGCDNDGTRRHWRCDECGMLFGDSAGNGQVNYPDIVIPALKHDFQRIEETPSTCVTHGTFREECTKCHKVMNSGLLDFSAHKCTIHVEAKEPTCTEEGNSEYWQCEVCSAYSYDSEGRSTAHPEEIIIPALAHRNAEYVTQQDASCTTDGRKQYLDCPDCNKYFQWDADGNFYEITDLVIPATGHNLSEHIEGQPATCMHDGQVEYWVCSQCHKRFADEGATTELSVNELTVEAIAHKNVVHVEAQEPTCTEDGWVEHWHCPDCGEDFLDKDCRTYGDVTDPAFLVFTKITGKEEYRVSGDNIKKRMAITVPESYKGLPVTTVGSFSSTLITEIVIPDSVKEINAGAFAQCSELVKVTLPNGITSIKYDTFCGCGALTEISLPASLTEIGGTAFADCVSLKEIVIPDGVKTIGINAFNNCKALENLTIGSGVTSIGEYAFANCENLRNLKYDAANCTVKEQSKAFVYAGASGDGIKITVGKHVQSIPDYLFGNGNVKLAELVFEDDSVCTAIGSYAFWLTDITGINLPDSVVTIGEYAFAGCGLQTATLGNGLKTVGEYAFKDCEALQTLDLGNSLESIGDGAFTNTKIVELTVPGTVKTWGEYTFADCKQLETLTLSEGITVIGKEAFKNCTSLKGVALPDSVVTVKEGAFAFCSAVTSLTLGENLKTIEYLAFHDFTSLKDLYFNSVAYVLTENQYGVFDVFGDEQEGFVLHIGSKVPAIPRDLFYYGASASTYLVKIEFARDSICTSIGSQAFACTYYLKEINLPEGLLTIENEAFMQCNELEEVTIPESVKFMDSYAFHYCNKLKTINYNAIECKTENAFTNGYSEEAVPVTLKIGEKVKVLPGWLTYQINVKKLIFPDVIPEGFVLSSYAVSGTLKEVYVSDVTEWLKVQLEDNNASPWWNTGALLYIDGEAVTDLVIPDGVTSIPDYSFEGMSITSLTIGKNVTSIGRNAFDECRELTEIHYNAIECQGSEEEYWNVFWGAGTNAAMNVTIGAEVKKIPERLFMHSGYDFDGNLVFEEGSVCEEIGADAFSGCRFGNVTLAESILILNNGAFGNGKIKNLYAPATVENAGGNIKDSQGAFFSCEIENAEVPAIVLSAMSTTYLVSLKINGGTRIEAGKFRGNGIKEITIGSSVGEIGEDAFEYCTGLESVYVESLEDFCAIDFANEYASPLYYATKLYVGGELVSDLTFENIETISGCAFANFRPLTGLVVGNGVREIGGSAFANCPGLKEISLGNDLQKIGENAFNNCTGVTTITIPQSVKYIGANAFAGLTYVTGLYYNAIECADFEASVFNKLGKDVDDGTKVYIGDGVKVIPANFISNFVGVNYVNNEINIGEVVFGNNSVCKKIGKNAFEGNYELATIDLPATVEEIGDEAFTGCTGLYIVNLPKNLKTIGNYAFNYCTALRNIRVECDNLSDTEGTAVLNNYPYGTFYMAGYESNFGLTVEVAANVGRIPAYIFARCSVTQVQFQTGSACAEIGDYAFAQCEKLTGISAPDSVVTVGAHAFDRCKKLASVNLPGAESIGDSAFFTCDKITALSLPDTLKTVGTRAFYSCSGITQLTLGNGVENIGDSAFAYCRGVSQLTLPDSLKTIDSNAFYDWRLTELTVGSGIEKIGSNAFGVNGTLTLQKVNVTDLNAYCHITFADEGACPVRGAELYMNGVQVTTLNLQNVTAVKSYAFYAVDGVTKVIVPVAVEYIGSYAFSTYSLNEVELEVPSGSIVSWSCAFTETKEQRWIDLSDPAANGVYMRSTYAECYWISPTISDDTFQYLNRLWDGKI